MCSRYYNDIGMDHACQLSYRVIKESRNQPFEAFCGTCTGKFWNLVSEEMTVSARYDDGNFLANDLQAAKPRSLPATGMEGVLS